MKRTLLLIAVIAAGVGGAWWLNAAGAMPDVAAMLAQRKAPKAELKAPPPPAITVATARIADFVETLVVPGTLVAREEIIVAPEVEGLRVLEVKVDESQRVEKGQVLAVLETATLDAQLAQNTATIARNIAGMAQAESSITQAQARLEEASNALARAKPLRQSGTISEAIFDQREAAARTAQAQLAAARDGLKVAQAEKAQTEALRREIEWKRSRTEVKAPVDGVVARRNARIGAMATATGDVMFRLIAGGEVELDAEVPEQHLVRVRPGQQADVEIAGLPAMSGRVRIVSPEIDRATRLGRVRILIETMERPRVGSFGKATVRTAASRGLAVPSSAVQFAAEGARVQVLVDDRVMVRKVTTGLQSGDLIEITQGLREGEPVVVRAGTFLREGDLVKPVALDAAKVSEVK